MEPGYRYSLMEPGYGYSLSLNPEIKLFLKKNFIEYSKSPIYEEVPFQEHAFKSNLFINPTNLALVPNECNWPYSIVL